MTIEGKDGAAPVEHVKGRKRGFVMNRMQRRHLMDRTKYNNNRKPKNSGFLQMGNNWGWTAIHSPKRKKLKGWQKELKRNKRAA